MAQDDVILTFPMGLIGFSGLTRYRLLEPQDGYPLKFLQALDREDISFTCMDVQAFKPDYTIALGDEDAQGLDLREPADAMVLALVVIPKDPMKMTANLAGPVVVNVKTRVARQIVRNIEQFPLAHPVFPGK